MRRLGYEPLEQVVTLARDTTIVLRTSRSTQVLDTVSVSASGMPARYGPSSIMETFYERRQRGRGRFFTREDLEASGHSDMQPLLASVPGTRVRTGAGGGVYLHFPRCVGSNVISRGSGTLAAVTTRQRDRDQADTTALALYVDGVPINRGVIPSLLGELSVGQIEAMEVYRGVSELPAEAMGNTCAAIYIWTRRSVGNVTDP